MTRPAHHPARRARAASAPASTAPSRSSSGARELWRAGLCPPRDRPQPLRGRGPARPRARSSSRSSTRCPTDRPVVFSAHGVPKSVPAEAERAATCSTLDATCPLVSKVHREAERHHEAGRQIVLIGHAGHPEVIGTMGQLPRRRGDAGRDRGRRRGARRRADPDQLAYITQTTLSVDDTAEIVAALQRALPGDRRAAQRRTSATPPPTARRRSRRSRRECDALLVIGAPNSSNSHAPGRGRGAAPAAPSAGWSSAPPTSTGAGSTGVAGSASPPAPRRPRCWSRR